MRETRTPGSLSLDFDIPIDGRKFVFTKAGGDPRLTVAILPHRSFDVLAWTGGGLGWGVLGLLAIVALGQSRRASTAARSLPLVAVAVGVLFFLVFPAPVSWLGLVILAAATGIETVRRMRVAQSQGS